MNDNLKNLILEQSNFVKNHKFSNCNHTINLDSLDCIYKDYYSNLSNFNFAKDICKKFDSCDLESLIILEKFVGD